MKGAVASGALMTLLLTGCGSSITHLPPDTSSTATLSTIPFTATNNSTPPNANTPFEEWKRRGIDAWGKIQQAWDDMGPALSARDSPRIQAACRRVGEAGRELGASLPTPVPQATELLQKALDEFAGAERKCQTFGARVNGADIEEFNADIARGGQYMTSAAQAW
jgi:hypothetical protein